MAPKPTKHSVVQTPAAPTTGYLTIPVTRLRLDPENPRLPEELRSASESQVFQYLYDNGVLEEIADSMLDNGFFAHEPLIVLPPDVDGRRIVVEGNRRLAALMLIHGHPSAAGRSLPEKPEATQLERLLEVPAFQVQSRQEVSRFLGYRHISGLKPWKPEAKARYIAAEVDAAAHDGIDDPFYFVARRVGSNSQGIRTFYIALALLKSARSDCGFNGLHVLNERFGVWLRCMNSQEIRQYIGLGSPRTHKEVRGALQRLDCRRLVEVLEDLSPQHGKTKPALADSRDVTKYGLVLQNDQAHAVLRKYNDLELAKQIVTQADIPTRLQDLRRRIDAIREEIQGSVDESSQELITAAEELSRSARFLQGVVAALGENA